MLLLYPCSYFRNIILMDHFSLYYLSSVWETELWRPPVTMSLDKSYLYKSPPISTSDMAMWLFLANATLTLNINLSSWNILPGFQIPYIWGMPNSHVEWSTWKKTVVPRWQSQLSTVWMKPFRPLILPRGLPDTHCKGGKILLYQISDQNRKFLYLLDKETVNLWRNGKTKVIRLGK